MTESTQWEAATYEGSRRAQLRQTVALTVRERLQLLDELNRTAEHLATMPRATADPAEALATYDPGDGRSRHVVRLDGCRPVPLGSYLKALGVLRLVSEQVDSEARGWWDEEGFVLWSQADAPALVSFFLESYAPTPILAPWNGGSGFYPKDKTDAVEGLEAGAAVRFQGFREAIAEMRHHVAAEGLDERPSEGRKEAFLTRLRSETSPELLPWIDAAVVLSGDGPSYPPLLGTGGNDGRLEFSNNFMQRLVGLFDPDSGAASEGAGALLDSALFDAPAPGVEKVAIGQFAPGRAGGPNASTGYSGDSLVNPWDFVLMLEGALLFAARTSRRLEGERSGHLSFPFTVRTTGAGAGNTATADEADARAETWVPLWPRPATASEVGTMLGEGRVCVGRRTAGDGLDFVRAVAKLGVERGIGTFQRYAYLMRAGRSYLATPLNRVTVRRNTRADLVDQLESDDWLARFRSLARDRNAPGRLERLGRGLSDALFALAEDATDPIRATQQALMTIGEVQAYLATSPKSRERCLPVPVLDEDWVEAADDATAEFRIAAALAGLHARKAGPTGVRRTVLPMAAHLSPIREFRAGNRWIRRWDEEAGHRVVWGPGSLHDNLHRVLLRRLLDEQDDDLADRPLSGWASAPLGAVAAWLASDLDEGKIERLLPGLVLARVPVGAGAPMDVEWPPPAAYAFLKPLFTPVTQLRRIGRVPAEARIPLPPRIPRLLAAGRGEEALDLSHRTLRVHGFVPTGPVTRVRSASGQRLVSALMVPLSDGELRRLLGPMFEKGDPDQPSANTPTQEGS